MEFYRLNIIVFILYFLVFSSCKSQTDKNETAGVVKISSQEKAKEYNCKDLSVLSNYIDTLRLHKYYNQIKAFKIEDSLNQYTEIDVAFVGSSSIRKWKNLQKDMQGLKVLNRGFGGSSVPEAIYYSDILFFNRPIKKIVFYSGDNDLVFLRSNPEKIISSYKYLYNILSSKLPNTEIYFLSVKPSPGRWRYWEQMQEINTALIEFCKTNLNCKFIDVSSCLVNESGTIKNELFKKDGVHLNKQGYQVWTNIIYPAISE